MTVRVIADANPLSSIHLLLLKLNSHVQKITRLSTAICSENPTSLLFMNIQMIPVVVNIVVR